MVGQPNNLKKNNVETRKANIQKRADDKKARIEKREVNRDNKVEKREASRSARHAGVAAKARAKGEALANSGKPMSEGETMKARRLAQKVNRHEMKMGSKEKNTPGTFSEAQTKTISQAPSLKNKNYGKANDVDDVEGGKTGGSGSFYNY